MATNEQVEGALRGIADFASRDRRMGYSFTFAGAAAIMFFMGHIDVAILNMLAAIWLKMDSPR